MTIKIKTQQDECIGISVLTFSGGERHIQLEPAQTLPVNEVDIRITIKNSDEILDLLLIVNALRHEYGDALVINLTIPYLPYARQDRVCAQGQAFSLEVFAGLLNTLNLNQLKVWDCHSKVGVDLTGAINISSEDIIASCPELVEKLKADDAVLICPDKGAKARCNTIKEKLGLDAMVQCLKKRDPKTGHIVSTEVLADSLDGKTAIIVDDICDGGFTFIKIAERLKEKKVTRVILYVTHGIFSKGLDVFDGLIDEIYTTDSFERNMNNNIINYISYQ